tara:strand:+ start:309 stop:497 length:189 start_codon:yes stop_codon:yes gene_type:complete
MKKLLTITTILLTLVGCGSSNYLPCPAYSSNDNYYETEAIHENLTQEEYNELIACQNCDEID